MSKKLLFLVWYSIFRHSLGDVIKSCQKFASSSLDSCLSCSEGYYSLKESAFQENPFPIGDCIQKINTILEMEIYVSASECSSSSACNGSQDDPFDNLMSALDMINDKAKMYSQTRASLFLLGNELFILQKDAETALKYYFRKTLIALTISPFPCSLKFLPGCKENAETIILNIKTNQILFFVSLVLNIKNLVIIGADMPLEKVSTVDSPLCYAERKSCCLSEDSLIKEKIFCNANPNTVKVSSQIYGLFNTESIISSISSPLPSLVMENCRIIKILTYFPTDAARFSTLVHIMDNIVDLTLTNLIITDSFFVEGLVKQRTTPNSVEDRVSGALKSNLKVENMSLSNFKSLYNDEKDGDIRSIIFLSEFKGSLFLGSIFIELTVSSKLIFLDFNKVLSSIEITEVYYRDNEDLNFFRCKNCKILKLWNLVFFNSKISLTRGDFLLDIRDSEEIKISHLALKQLSFTQQVDDKAAALTLSNIHNQLELLDIHLDNTFCSTIKIESSTLLWRKLVITDLSSDYRFLSSINCSLVFEEILFSYINMRFEFFLSLRSHYLGSNYVLRITQGHFSNITFFKEADEIVDHGFIEWPLFTKSDSVFLSNISIFNCSHNLDYFYVTFFIAFSFAKVEVENVNFSFHQGKRNTLLYLKGASTIRVDKVVFSSNVRIDYYLMSIYCPECIAHFTNVKVELSSFRLACFFFKSLSGIFENFTLTQISEILPLGVDLYSFNRGFIVFRQYQKCSLKNWLFRSSENYYFIPSRFILFEYNTQVILQDITLHLYESKSNPPETHILAALFNRKITIERLTGRNFFCQRSVPGYTLYEGGIVSIFNSQTFLKDASFEGQVYLTDFFLENCKHCKNGVIGIVNVQTLFMKNISVTRSENLNGGAVAIYFGRELSIENIQVQNTLAIQYGGGIFLSGCSSIIIRGAFIANVRALFGGSIFLRNVETIRIFNLLSINSTAESYGGALYSLQSNVSFEEKGSAVKCNALKEGAFIFIRKGNLKILGPFDGQAGLAFKGGFLFALDVGEIILNGVTISNSSGIEEGSSLHFEDCANVQAVDIILTEIYSEGLGNINIIIRFKPASYEIKNIICSKVSMLSSILIYLENELTLKRSLQFALHNVHIADGRGSNIAAFKSASLYKEHSFLLQNISVRNFTIYHSTKSLDLGLFYLAFIFDNIYLVIRNVSLNSSTFEYTCFYISGSHVTLESLFFEVESDDYNNALGTRFLIHAAKTSGTLRNIYFLGSDNARVSMLLSEESVLVIEKGFVMKCCSLVTSCIEMFLSNTQVRSFQFTENKGFPSGVFHSRNSSLSIISSDFKKNTAVFGSGTQFTSFSNFANIIIIFGHDFNEPSHFANCTFSESYPGLSILIKASNINISDCLFLAEPLVGAFFPRKAILCSSSDIKFFKSNFSHFFSDNGGTLTIEQSTDNGEANVFSFINSVISNSTSDYGGAFSIIGTFSINISESLFAENKALKNNYGDYGNFGVGVVTCSPSSAKVSFQLLNNIFLNNRAENAIATIFSTSKIITSPPSPNSIEKDTNLYLKNQDGISFKGNLAYLPLKIYVFYSGPETNNNDSIVFRSGQAFDLRISLFDNLDQEYILDDDSRGVLSESLRVEISYFLISKTLSLSSKGQFFFQNLLIKADLNKSFELQLNIALNAKFLYPKARKLIQIDPPKLNFFSKACEVGDIIIEGDSSCLKCPPGKFSLADPMRKSKDSYLNLKCLDCPVNAICTGGSIIIPRKGFWRYSNSSTMIVECLSKISCLGSSGDELILEEEKIHGKCLQHSHGPLCYICEAGYGRFTKDGPCRDCVGEVVSYIKLTILLVLILVFTLIQIQMTFQAKLTSNTGILLKIMVTHFHQLSLISLIEFEWSSDFKGFAYLEDVFSFVSDGFMPMDCFFQKFRHNVFTQKVIATFVFPIILSMLIAFFWVLFLFFSSKRKSLVKRKIVQIAQVSFLIVVVLLFPEVIKKCLSLLTCIKVENSGSITLLLYSPEIICWSEEHKKYLMYAAVPGLLIWALIIPLTMIYFLIKNKPQIKIILEQAKMVQSLGLSYSISAAADSNSKSSRSFERAMLLKFLYIGYSKECFYWELFVFFKKFLLTSIGCISDAFPTKVRGVFLLVLISFFLLIQIRCKPFESPVINKLEFFSLLSIFLTADIGILMFSYDSKKFAIPLLVFVLCMHGLFLSVWTLLFLREFTDSHLKFLTKYMQNSCLKSTEKNFKSSATLPIAEEFNCSSTNQLQPRHNLVRYMHEEEESPQSEEKFLRLS